MSCDVVRRDLLTEKFEVVESTAKVQAWEKEEMDFDKQEEYKFLWREDDTMHLAHATSFEQITLTADLFENADLAGDESIIVYYRKDKPVRAKKV